MVTTISGTSSAIKASAGADCVQAFCSEPGSRRGMNFCSDCLTRSTACRQACMPLVIVFAAWRVRREGSRGALSARSRRCDCGLVRSAAASCQSLVAVRRIDPVSGRAGASSAGTGASPSVPAGSHTPRAADVRAHLPSRQSQPARWRRLEHCRLRSQAGS